jgi:multidrug efflux pump subunit AcrA (membrane-fusion protein)
VKEYSLNELRLEQQGYVTTDATLGRIYDSKLSFISPKATSPAGSTSVEFEIHARILENDTDVKIGMNAFLNIITDRKADVFAIPLSALATDNRGSFVYIIDNGEVREIAVSQGLKTSTHVEIDGEDLYEGMQILARPADRR